VGGGSQGRGACYTAVYPVGVDADADSPCLVEVALVLVESLVIFPVAVGKGWVAGLVGGVLESVPVREPDVVRGVMVREAAARDMSVITDPGLP